MDPVGIMPDAARKLIRYMRQAERTPRPYPKRSRGERMFLPGGGYRVGTIEEQLTARDDGPPIVPGGPVSFQPMTLEGSEVVADGSPVDLYSWVRTPSADPADESDGKLWVAAGIDLAGTYWFAGQDCTETPASVRDATSTADLIVTTAIQAIPGTSLPVTHAGVHNYAYGIELEITGIPGNQAWDVSVGAYLETAAVWLFTRTIAGEGSPVFSPTLNASGSFEIAESAIGDNLVLAAVRSTTTGTVTIPVGEANHQLTGPIK